MIPSVTFLSRCGTGLRCRYIAKICNVCNSGSAKEDLCGVMAADSFCTIKLVSQSARLDSDALNPLETLTGTVEDLTLISLGSICQ